VTIKAFASDSCISDHGDFDGGRFWEEEFIDPPAEAGVGVTDRYPECKAFIEGRVIGAPERTERAETRSKYRP
jgi:hypothetical protein